jgi:small-conductance mechanosensitive channel
MHERYTMLLITVRDLLLPLLVVVVLMRFVFLVQEENMLARIVSTIFWLLLITTMYRVSRLLIGNGDYAKEDWRRLVPHMLLRLPPYTIMGLILYHIIQDLWAFPIREMATTLGIGSIVVAFALQDTLSNLVSGILLVANSPFKTGDWIHVGDVEGKITAVNWRYTNLETWQGDLIVIPNGSIAGESIQNHSRPKSVTTLSHVFKVAFSNAPNTVKDMFFEVMENTPGILSEPAPSVAVVNVDDPVMEYEVEFCIDDYGNKFDIQDDFMTRVWYALRRHGLSLPTPEYNINHIDTEELITRNRVSSERQLQFIESLPHFSTLPKEVRRSIADSAIYQPYATAETVVKVNKTEAGMYVIMSGEVTLARAESELSAATVLRAGNFFGETGLFGRALSPYTVTACCDIELLIIPHDLINDIIIQHPRFATEMSLVVEKRRTLEQGLQRTSVKRGEEALQ